MFCPKCGQEISNNNKFCQHCGTEINPVIPTASTISNPIACQYCGRQFGSTELSTEHEKYCQQNPNNIIKSQDTNTSGMGESSIVPPEIKGWSWGAFLWSWIWAIGNKTYIGLLALVPYVNFVMIIILGINGREWAWKNKHWDSVDQFKKVQHNWVKWWLILMIIPVIIGIIAIFSVGILATINPIEQTHKAADATTRNNLAELLVADERYYTQNNSYPWSDSTNSLNMAYVSTDLANETWLNILVTSGEIKSTLVSQLKANSGKLILIKESGNDSDIHFCFQPQSTANKTTATTECQNHGTFTNGIGGRLCTTGQEYLCLP